MKLRENISKISHNLIDYLLFVSALLAIYGAGIYYLYALNWFSIVLIIILVIISFFVFHKYLFKDQNESKIILKEGRKKSDYLPYLVYFILYGLSFYILYKSSSNRSLISPWQVIKPSFFIYYILSSVTLIYILFKNKLSNTAKLIALSAHYFLSFGISLIVYKIGYGYDPFIHQATMELIDKKGLVTPKPLYYLGEYGLVVTLHKISGISIYILNKFLVPVLASIFLPLAAYRLRNKNGSKSSRWLAPIFILIIGFSPFIASTPQNLSYLFLILTILFGLSKKNILWPLILSIATLAIHPLTGIPAFFWVLILALYKNYQSIKSSSYKIGKTILFILSSLTLPLALFISGGSDFKKITWNLNLITEPLVNLFNNLSSAGQEDWLLNFVYFFSYNYNLYLVAIITISLIFFYRQKENRNFRSLIFINISLVVAYLISSQIIFTDLIDYEQSNFAARLLVLITIFFLPFIILELQKFIDLILLKDKLTKTIYLIFGLALITASLYVSYPRYDKYLNSRGYSTSANDIKAVKLIDSEAKNPYIVLANQQVSVAALKELGFDNYHETKSGPIFFYPIPTGGLLYQYYLDSVEKKPSRETMVKAMNLTGIKESYLIINKYWYQSGQLINEAKLNANSWKDVNGEVYIFQYLAD